MASRSLADANTQAGVVQTAFDEPFAAVRRKKQTNIQTKRFVQPFDFVVRPTKNKKRSLPSRWMTEAPPNCSARTAAKKTKWNLQKKRIEKKIRFKKQSDLKRRLEDWRNGLRNRIEAPIKPNPRTHSYRMVLSKSRCSSAPVQRETMNSCRSFVYVVYVLSGGEQCSMDPKWAAL